MAKAKQHQPSASKIPISETLSSTKLRNNFLLRKKTAQIILILCTLLVYANTLFNTYAIDDGIVITENKLTQQGFAGIKDLLTHDAFYGCLGDNAAQLVQGGRYRPLSLVTFALEYQFWGLNPGISHAINVLLFAGCVLLVFSTLVFFQQSFHPNMESNFWSWPFWASLCFALHPIHTEVVANIKGRDEIMALLFALTSLRFALFYLKGERSRWVLGTSMCYFLALLSKENSITFLAIIPLSYFFFTQAKRRQYITIFVALAIPAAIFLILRNHYAASSISTASTEILNNPFLQANTSQRYGTLLYTWFQYLILLIFPIQLSHDYYFNQIPYQDFFSASSIFSLLLHIALLVFVFKRWRSHKLQVYAILFYFISFSVVSNLFFSVGILMNERFVFVSSIGFCMMLALGLDRLSKSWTAKSVALLLLAWIIPNSAKTISRNADWKNNLSLLGADVHNSPNSAKVNASYAGILYEESLKIKDTLQQNEYLSLAYQHAQEALNIYPDYSDALQIMGNILYRYKKDYPAAIAHYQKAYQLNGQSNGKLLRNMGMAFVRNNDGATARQYLLQSEQLLAGTYATEYSLGEAYDLMRNSDSALYWYQKSIQIQPKDAIGYYKIGLVYARQLQQLQNGILYLQKAATIEPSNIVYLEDLAVAQGISGNTDTAIAVAQQILKINPKYTPAFRILSASYLKKGNKILAEEYIRKANSQ